MDRAHRIGQKNPVNVYRLIHCDTLEEKIVERGNIKLKLDSLVIQHGRMTQISNKLSKDEMKSLAEYGASKIYKNTEGTYTDEDIDNLLEREIK